MRRTRTAFFMMNCWGFHCQRFLRDRWNVWMTRRSFCKAAKHGEVGGVSSEPSYNPDIPPTSREGFSTQFTAYQYSEEVTAP